MDRLSGLDSMFLALEGPTTFMHVGQVSVFDPSTSPHPHSFDRVRQAIVDRLPLIPPFRRKVGSGGRWADDDALDVDHHIRRLSLDRPADERDLATVAGKILAQPLDRGRPLWEIWVVENLEGGHVATVAKVHHSAIDGVAGVEVMANLLDFEPDPPPVAVPDPDRARNEPTSSNVRRFGDAVSGLARRPLDAARLTGRSLRGARDLWRLTRAEGLPPAPFSAPATCLNVPISNRRHLAFASVPMQELREVKDAFAVTFNDVVLAVAAGALRSFLRDRDACPDKPLTAMMPISVRGRDDADYGNQVTMAVTGLATHVEDPIERLLRISQSARRAKAQNRIVGELLVEWPEMAPAGLIGGATTLYSALRLAQVHRPPFNVVISNVPGPDVPLYSAGAQMRANFPIGPIYEGVGLNITTMSYCDQMHFGLLACPDTVPELWALADAIGESFRRLQKASA